MIKCNPSPTTILFPFCIGEVYSRGIYCIVGTNVSDKHKKNILLYFHHLFQVMDRFLFIICRAIYRPQIRQ